MDNRSPRTQDVQHDSCQDDNELQALDSTSIEKLSRDTTPNNVPNPLPVTNGKRKSQRETLSNKEALERLEQAAHLWATGAIRAALKQKTEVVGKPAKKAPKPATALMSDLRTSPDFSPKTTEIPASKNAKKPLKKTRSANAAGKRSLGSKDLLGESAYLGSIS